MGALPGASGCAGVGREDPSSEGWPGACQAEKAFRLFPSEKHVLCSGPRVGCETRKCVSQVDLAVLVDVGGRSRACDVSQM